MAEVKDLLNQTGRMAKVGGWELNAKTLEIKWTEETFLIHELPIDSKPPLEEAINFYHPEDRPVLKVAIKRALEHGEPYDLELRFKTAKGKNLWIHTICKPHLLGGKTVRLSGTFQDITEKKYLDETIRIVLEETSSKTGKDFFYALTENLSRALHSRFGFISEFCDPEGTEPYPNSFSKQKYIRKPCLFNTLPHIKSLQTAGHREKFNSLHFPKTENGRGFDSRLIHHK